MAEALYVGKGWNWYNKMSDFERNPTINFGIQKINQ